MKKKLLLLCALMASVTGTWAQMNWTQQSGVSVSPVGSFVGPFAHQEGANPVDESYTFTQAQLNSLIDGKESTTAVVGTQSKIKDSGENWVNGDYKFQSFYIDLGADRLLGSIVIKWGGGKAKSYAIYAANNAAGVSDITESTWGTKIAGEDDFTEANNGSAYTVTYDDANIKGQTYRYIKFVATEQNPNNWDLEIKEFEIYDNNTPTLTTFTVSPAIVKVGTATTFTLTTLDGASNAISATYTLDGTAETFASAVTLSTEGAHTIVATDANGVSLTQTVYAIAGVNNAQTSDALTVFPGRNPDGKTYNGGWGSYSTFNLDTDHDGVLVTGVGTVGFTTFDSDFVTKAKDYTKIHLDFYAVEGGTLAIRIDGDGTLPRPYPTAKYKSGWNSIDVALTLTGVTNITWVFAEFSGGDVSGDNTVVIENIYFSKEAAVTPFDIETSGNVATITGAVTESDVTSSINTADVTFIDLSGITSITSDAISAINPLNANALVSIPATSSTETKAGFTGLEAVKNAVRVATWVFPVNQLDFTDANGAKWWTGEGTTVAFISAGDTGYKITRSVAGGSGKYISVCPHATVDLTSLSGVKVYKPTEATATEITFTEQDGVTSLTAQTPYILYVTGDVNLVASVTTGANNFYAHSTDGSTSTFETTIGSSTTKFVGTWADIDGDGSKYALQNNVVKKFNSGATIGSFRAYFTDLPSEAPEFTAIFEDADNNTTGVATIKANGEIEKAEVYNLAGQRVENAQKGIFIVNGKKVVLK